MVAARAIKELMHDTFPSAISESASEQSEFKFVNGSDDGEVLQGDENASIEWFSKYTSEEWDDWEQNFWTEDQLMADGRLSSPVKKTERSQEVDERHQKLMDKAEEKIATLDKMVEEEKVAAFKESISSGESSLSSRYAQAAAGVDCETQSEDQFQTPTSSTSSRMANPCGRRRQGKRRR